MCLFVYIARNIYWNIDIYWDWKCGVYWPRVLVTWYIFSICKNQMEPFTLWQCIPLCIYFVAHYYQHRNVQNKYSYCSVECTPSKYSNDSQIICSTFFFSPLAPKMAFSSDVKGIDDIFAWDEKRFLRQKRTGKYITRCHLLIWLTMFVVVVAVCSFRCDYERFVTCSIGHFWMYKRFVGIMNWYSRKKRHLWKRSLWSASMYCVRESLIQTRNSLKHVYMHEKKSKCIVVQSNFKEKYQQQ